MHTEQELLKLWANDEKRREFIKNYKEWGIWFTVPVLDLTFFKYDLPGGSMVIAMEYLREPYLSERNNGNGESFASAKFYLQRGKHFNPFSSSDHEMAGWLKDLKESLSKEQRQRDKHCKKCGSRCLRYKPDGSITCTACLAPVQ